MNITPTKKRSTKWGDADKVKFRMLVTEDKIDWERNDVKYLRKVRDKYWPRRRTPTFRTNWKVSTAEFRTESLLKGARHKLNKGEFYFYGASTL